MNDKYVMKSHSILNLGVMKTKATQRFVAAEHASKIIEKSSMTDRFRERFLNHEERDVPELFMTANYLAQHMTDDAIISCIGTRPRLYLANLFEVIIDKYPCSDYPLLTDGTTNVLHVNGGKERIFYSVTATWIKVRWFFDALDVHDPRGWPVGTRILGRTEYPEVTNHFGHLVEVDR